MTITLATFGATDTPTEADLRSRLFASGARDGTSLEDINGGLVLADLPAPLPAKCLARGHGVRAHAVGATANHDYFANWFPQVEETGMPPDSQFVAVPGLAVTFPVVWPTRGTVLGASGIDIFWHVSFIVDDHYTQTELDAAINPSPFGGTMFRLFLDDTATEVYSRGMSSRRTLVVSPDAADPPNNNAVLPDERHWCGHVLVHGGAGGWDPTSGTGSLRLCARGWHSVSLRLASHAAHVRVKSRAMVAIPRR